MREAGWMCLSAAVFLSCLAIGACAARGDAEHFTDAKRDFVGVDYEMYYAILDAYASILDRVPSEAELQAQKVRLQSDDQYDIPRLQLALRASDEYRRLVGLQKNSTLSAAEGVVTETQLRNKLAAMYTKVTGSAADPGTLDFLYAKFMDSGMNDAYVTALIENIGTASATGSGAGAGGSGAGAGGSGAGAGGVIGRVEDAATSFAKQLGVNGGGGGASATNAAAVAAAAAEIKALLATSCAASNGSPEGDRSACNAAAGRIHARDLAAAGYKSGPPLGSWTMPVPIQAPTCVGAKGTKALALPTQTELLGTPLQDVADETGNMNLY